MATFSDLSSRYAKNAAKLDATTAAPAATPALSQACQAANRVSQAERAQADPLTNRDRTLLVQGWLAH